MNNKEFREILRTKIYTFALRIVQLYIYLRKEKNEYLISKQLFKAGTSVGANYEEAIGGYSVKDFAAKLAICYKESREAHYWLRLLRDAGIIEEHRIKLLLDECKEIIKITSSSLSTIKQSFQ